MVARVAESNSAGLIRLAVLAVAAISALTLGCGDSREGEIISDSGGASTTTIFFGDTNDVGAANPSDFGSPGILLGLEGMTVPDAEEVARIRGWEQIESYSEAEYGSLSFDGGFLETRLRLIFDSETELVLNALVG